mgnify:CR=1 FL=1
MLKLNFFTQVSKILFLQGLRYFSPVAASDLCVVTVSAVPRHSEKGATVIAEGVGRSEPLDAPPPPLWVTAFSAALRVCSLSLSPRSWVLTVAFGIWKHDPKTSYRDFRFLLKLVNNQIITLRRASFMSFWIKFLTNGCCKLLTMESIIWCSYCKSELEEKLCYVSAMWQYHLFYCRGCAYIFVFRTFFLKKRRLLL